MVLSTPSYPAPQDTRSLIWWLGINIFIRGLGGDSFAEIKGISQATVDLGDAAEWTVFRVPGLKGRILGADDGPVNAVVSLIHRKVLLWPPFVTL